MRLKSFVAELGVAFAASVKQDRGGFYVIDVEADYSHVAGRPVFDFERAAARNVAFRGQDNDGRAVAHSPN
jgi:hypothetical protein